MHSRNLGKLACLFASLSMIIPSSQAQLLYEQDWKDGQFLMSFSDKVFLPEGIHTKTDCYSTEKGGFESFEISSKYSRSGQYSLRNELNGNKKNSYCPNGKKNFSEAKSRQELVIGYDILGMYSEVESKKPTHRVLHGDERWYGISYYYPSDEGTFDSWWSKGSECVMVFQHMAHEPSYTPEIFISLCGNGKLRIENYYSTDPDKEVKKVRRTYATFKQDQWNDMVVHFIRDWDSDGLIEIWVNGDLVTQHVGVPVSIRSKAYGYIGVGQYFGTEYRNQKYVQYIDAIKAGDHTSSFDEVNPARKGLPNPVILNLD